MPSKKSRECQEIEIYIDDLFESLNDGYIVNYAEVEYICNYLRSQLDNFEEENM